jgi:hypothetical protein
MGFILNYLLFEENMIQLLYINHNVKTET